MAIEQIGTGIYSFDILAGATFTRFINISLPKVQPTDPTVPYPLGGFTGKAQIRKNASTPAAYDFIVTIIADGLIKLEMDAATTSSIVCGNLITDMKSKYQWALELAHTSGEVLRPLEGIVRISPEIVK